MLYVGFRTVILPCWSVWQLENVYSVKQCQWHYERQSWMGRMTILEFKYCLVEVKCNYTCNPHVSATSGGMLVGSICHGSCGQDHCSTFVFVVIDLLHSRHKTAQSCLTKILVGVFCILSYRLNTCFRHHVLPDGIHPDNTIKQKWAKTLLDTISINRYKHQ